MDAGCPESETECEADFIEGVDVGEDVSVEDIPRVACGECGGVSLLVMWGSRQVELECEVSKVDEEGGLVLVCPECGSPGAPEIVS